MKYEQKKNEKCKSVCRCVMNVGLVRRNSAYIYIVHIYVYVHVCIMEAPRVKKRRGWCKANAKGMEEEKEMKGLGVWYSSKVGFSAGVGTLQRLSKF